MIFIDAFFSFAAGGRHHLGGDAVIRQRRCGYSAALPRLFGNCIAVIGHQLGVDAVIGQLRCGYWASPGGDAVIRTRRTERWGVPQKENQAHLGGCFGGPDSYN